MHYDSATQQDYLNSITLVTAEKRYPLHRQEVAPELFYKHNLIAEAKRWTYVLQSRSRWKKNKTAIEQHENSAIKTLIEFGLTDDQMKEIAGSKEVMVEMPYTDEKLGWAGRIFPWEFILTIATRRFRKDGDHLVVLRYLKVNNVAAKWKAPSELSVLFVQSQPDVISTAYEIDSEAELVRKAFAFSNPSSKFRLLKSPTLDELATEVAAFRPDVIHFAGFDNHQGARIVREVGGAQTLIWISVDGVLMALPAEQILRGAEYAVDGVLLRHEDGKARITSSEELGKAVTAGNHKPYLVCLNTWNSAARAAPLILAAGAIAGVGFQDAFSDALGEFFYEAFYRKLAPPWNVPAAFQSALEDVLAQPDLGVGTGLVLWGAAPLIQKARKSESQRQRMKSIENLEAGLRWIDAIDVATVNVRVPDAAPQVPIEPAEDAIQFRIRPKKELNYSVLHNQGRLFEDFELRNMRHPHKVKAEVVIELHCGSEKARYSSALTIDGQRMPMVDRIRVPLTSSLIRSVSEAMQSSLFVEIKHENQPIFRDTFPLRLLPVDQWLDNEHSGQWLPSFVLPRDPAVEAAISVAQRYVRVISDDPTAGFNGYQSANPADPASLDQVDLQVEAIWATLLHEWQLGYINPPPTYANTSEGVLQLDSQRLRTPSCVRRISMGTCIDLALLFAACLELVDIYPVIFLLEGHALPGYWRHHDFQVQYRDVRTPDEEEPPTQDESILNPSPGIQAVPWRIEKSGYLELRKEIRAGRLVPLETVRLTEHGSFREAMLAGIDALSNEADFDSVLDIITARHPHNVTPLPVLED